MMGQTISHYKILEKLGEGGMGVVYKAEDTNLKRIVALKFLPQHLTKTAQEQTRFQQEAQSAATLNHPNICTIHAIEEYEGQRFIDMEFVDGETLRKKLPIGKVADAVTYAIQIGEALQEAHGKGVVHRDIKCENIMVNSKNQVKVMDFGLAKLKGSLKLTKTSSTVGTLAYMAPEQIQGGEVDERSDIFSSGVVLYEMLTGKLPFRGEHEAAMMYSIVNEEPEALQTHLPEAPSELLHVLNTALEKDKEDRYQTAVEMVRDLRRIEKQSARVSRQSLPHMKVSTNIAILQGSPQLSSVAPTTSVRKSRKKLIIGLGIGLIAVVVIASLWFSGVFQQNVEVPPIQATFTQLTDQAGAEDYPNISPDGNFIIYSKQVDKKKDIFLQRVGGGNPINLTQSPEYDDNEGSFSPDGQLIAFRSERSGGGIFLMGATGESVRRLIDFGYNPSWSSDGKEIICATENSVDPYVRGGVSQIWGINVSSGEKRRIYERDAMQPQWSPHRTRIACWGFLSRGSGQRDIFTISAAGSEPVAITNDIPTDWNPVWSSDGRYIYFSSDRGGTLNLWRVAIDEATGKILSELQPITTPSRSSGFLSISHDGHHLVYEALDDRSNIQTISFDPSTATVTGTPFEVTQGTMLHYSPDVSPDGQWIVFQGVVGPQEDIYVIKKNGTGLRQLTNDVYRDRGPVVSPDGRRIAFYSNRSGRYEIWSINADGSELEQLTLTTGSTTNTPFWFPDGKQIGFQGDSGTMIVDLTKQLKERTPRLFPLLDSTGAHFWGFSVSPNGEWIVGRKTQHDVVLYSVKNQNYQVMSDSVEGSPPVWFNDNKRILIHLKDTLFVLDVQTRKLREIIAPLPEMDPAYLKLSPDNRTLFFVKKTSESDIWQATLK